MKLAIEMTGITKHFDDLLANDSVDFRVKKGEIHALVGENGAGKTTLINILYGLYQPDSGQIVINGEEKTISSPSHAISLGIGMVHQHFMLVETLTVLENIILGDEDVYFSGLLNFAIAKKKLEEIIKTFSLNIELDSIVETLPVGIQQKIEILKVLYRKSDILIFDEPTAVLTPQEADELFSLLKNLKQEGKTVILITHKLNEVLTVSDTVTILRHGKLIGEKITSQTNRVQLTEMIIGGNLPGTEEKYGQKKSSIILEVSNLTVENDRAIDAVKDTSFWINSGEILGIAGIEGSGQTELVEAINGLRKIKKGKIKIMREVEQQEPESRRNNKHITISHIPANRHKHGIVNEYKLFENILLGRQNEKRFGKGFIINEKELISFTGELIEKYDVRPGNAMQEINELSGGNQQKLVAGRELTKKSDLIVACHPTRGLDIKASVFVLNTLLEERNKGKAVLLVSSDLNELLQITDRIGIMYNGKMSVVLNTYETNEREIGLYMTGYTK